MAEFKNWALKNWACSMSSSDESMSMLPSLEEADECVFQMDSSPPSAAQAISTHQHHQNPYHILEGIVEPSTQVEIELHQRAMKHVREIGDERKRSSLKRRLMMRLKKDGYHASLCRSSWVATTEHPGGDYEYIDVVVAREEHGAGAGAGAATSSSSSSSSTRLVVDIDFRSQFELARPTPRYAQLWSRLPAVFVGPRARLRSAVSLLCAEAQRSLRESGLHVPPWRRPGYMQAKWLPGETLHVAAPVEEVAVAREPRGRGGGLTMAMARSGSGAGANGCHGHAGFMRA